MRPFSIAKRPKVDVPSPTAMKAGPSNRMDIASGGSANQRKRLVAMRLHEFFGVAFYVEPKERFGVRRTDVHPPMRVRDREPVKLVDLRIAVVLFDLVEFRRDVGNRAI